MVETGAVSPPERLNQRSRDARFMSSRPKSVIRQMRGAAFSGIGVFVDFVVVGLGLGALMMLAGFGLRDLGPWLFGFANPDSSLPEFEAVKATIRKQTLASIGTAIATAGVGLAIVTFAALIARTEDDLGTIVVGMSLALAAVGVGAWTYDAIRRYRAAMDVVSGQELTVMNRIAPAPLAASEQKKSRLSTKPDERPERSSKVQSQAIEAEALAEPQTSSDVAIDSEDRPSAESSAGSDVEPPSAEHSEVNPSSESEFNEPSGEGEEDVDIDLSDPEADFPATWNMPAAATVPVANDEQKNEVAEAAEGPPESEERSHGIKERANERAAAPRSASQTPRSRIEAGKWQSADRIKSPAPQPPDESDFAHLPPLPGEQEDALIDESVRFDRDKPINRNVPSWLFDDLETDLNKPGASRSEDPIDQFRGSQPKQRGSALDRILAGEEDRDKRKNDSDDESGESDGN